MYTHMQMQTVTVAKILPENRLTECLHPWRTRPQLGQGI